MQDIYLPIDLLKNPFGEVLPDAKTSVPSGDHMELTMKVPKGTMKDAIIKR